MLNEFDVPLDRIIGICSDGAHTMQGRIKGVCTQLANSIRDMRVAKIAHIRARAMHGRPIDSFHEGRGIFVVHCVCHRLALVLTDAIKGTKNYEKVIPEDVVALLNMLYNYFARSPARKQAMREYIASENRVNQQNQQRVQAERMRAPPAIVAANPVVELERVLGLLEERHKLPRKVVLTRWLSCAEAVRVVLNCRDLYYHFFFNENNANATDIVELLEDSAVIAWYACLQDVLPVLTGMNVLFQSSLPLPHLLYPRISSAKATLINMVGTGATRVELIPLASVDKNTSFGAFANKFMRDIRGDVAITGTRLLDQEVLELKQGWHKLYSHCLEQIDGRFPPENMKYFKLMQILDPALVHGPLKRDKIGTDDLTVVLQTLLHIFEIPLHGSGLALPEEITNSFTVFRTSDVCADLWKETTKGYAGREKPFEHGLIYPYYRMLMHMPALKPYALFALFLLVFPTGNAISERGFSAMGAIHTKQRSEMSHAQVLAHLILGFNGPSVPEFAALLNVESRQPHWDLYIPPCNFN